MERRSFFKLLGLAGLAALHPGCALTVESPADEADGGDADVPPADVTRLVDAGADTRPPPGDAAEGIVIRERFQVLLNDTSCSGHDHGLTVEAGTYPPGVAVHYLGGSHDVALDPTELKLLEGGARLPFATGGTEEGHGHCGMAWRTSVGPAERGRVDACVLRSATSVCSRRR